MARIKNKTTKEKLEDALFRKEELHEETVKNDLLIAELQKQLEEEQFEEIKKLIHSSNLTFEEVQNLIKAKTETVAAN